jgi:hypothetical protein
MAIDWWTLSAHEGYDNPRLMLEDMYHKHNWSTARIAAFFKISTSSVLGALKKFGVKRKQWGGNRYETKA